MQFWARRSSFRVLSMLDLLKSPHVVSEPQLNRLVFSCYLCWRVYKWLYSATFEASKAAPPKHVYESRHFAADHVSLPDK